MVGSEGEPDPRPAEPSDSDTDDGGSTRSTSKRHWLTNDLLAGALALSLILVVAAHGAGWLNLQTLPQWLVGVYVFSVGSSVAWAFGKDAVEAWRGGK